MSASHRIETEAKLSGDPATRTLLACLGSPLSVRARSVLRLAYLRQRGQVTRTQLFFSLSLSVLYVRSIRDSYLSSTCSIRYSVRTCVPSQAQIPTAICHGHAFVYVGVSTKCARSHSSTAHYRDIFSVCCSPPICHRYPVSTSEYTCAQTRTATYLNLAELARSR